MTATTTTHLYGVGFKGWVEIRKASSPPRPYLTRRTYTGVRCVYARSDRTNGWFWTPPKEVPCTKTLVNTTWVGGRVIGGVRPRLFQSRVGVRCGNGKMVEIPEAKAHLFLKEWDQKRQARRKLLHQQRLKEKIDAKAPTEAVGRSATPTPTQAQALQIPMGGQAAPPPRGTRPVPRGRRVPSRPE